MDFQGKVRLAVEGKFVWCNLSRNMRRCDVLAEGQSMDPAPSTWNQRAAHTYWGSTKYLWIDTFLKTTVLLGNLGFCRICLEFINEKLLRLKQSQKDALFSPEDKFDVNKGGPPLLLPSELSLPFSGVEEENDPWMYFCLLKKKNKKEKKFSLFHILLSYSPKVYIWLVSQI